MTEYGVRGVRRSLERGGNVDKSSMELDSCLLLETPILLRIAKITAITSLSGGPC